ncbi:hypothetical protein [Pseudoteredinibacter isoporae]|uniref:Uncharacterized protein n=1 Tax=Pseudoteredinibacter isoporae TaxID=570281 RepID=A0A7X0JVG6_9GAMM|nr:hypothetical protein [Pseudoteredinibacter isoporae]MBB6523010.1 hypothetical protein [Pseudoteredinibacter isoporae]NHO88532.1 hypothetical protein [Pseudoteredinibacter isoporae]NIB22777.1 hypothetical protein [Pseudoteredinibacter isoporae]
MDSNKTHQEFGIVKEDYLEWRSPRFGTSHAERIDNNVWKWLIHTGISAYCANEEMRGPDPFEAGPAWCFDRFGQSTTELPDGRKIYIAGEHEDSYDPDFYIYNDVVVINLDGSIEIYAYPRNCFLPTDFHSSTLVDDKIVIIGNLGYPDDRQSGKTQVYTLDTTNYKIESIPTSGDSPGWIHLHTAELDSENQIIRVKGGVLYHNETSPLIENIDEWQLDIRNWTWQRLSKKEWFRFEVKRSDNQLNLLWEIRGALWNQKLGWKRELKESLEKLTGLLGLVPDIELLKEIYRPPVTHVELEQYEDEYGTYRILVEGVVVRYVEDFYGIQVTIEGSLSENIIKTLTDDLVKKLEKLENTQYETRLLRV